MGNVVKGLLFALWGLMLYACEGPVNSTQDVEAKLEPKTPEHILAALEAGSDIEKNHPSISRFALLLDEISAKCVNDRDEISRTTIKIQKILGERGIEISLSELLKRFNRNMPEVEAGQRYDFNQIATAFQGLNAAEFEQN